MMSKDVLEAFTIMCRPDKPLAWLASTGKNYEPHLVPLCFVRPLDEKRIIIGGVFIRETEHNIESNPRIALSTAFKEGGWNGYLVKGRAKVYRSGEKYDSFRKEVLERSKGKRGIESIIILIVEEIYSLKPRKGRKRLI